MRQREPPAEPALPAELAGGSWSAGRDLFFGKEARCAECHAVRGRGGTIGPDLSNLAHRDYASVLRDIREPSFAINPDHITYSLALVDGRLLSGTVRSSGANLRVGDSQGRETVFAQSDVEAMQPQSVSTMPEGLVQLLGAAKLKDLLTFLLAPELLPAPVRREGAPPPRTRAEVDAVVKPARPAGDEKVRPLQIVLVSGPKDHGVDEHDYPLWQERWSALLGRAEGVTVTTAQGWPTTDDFARADVLVWYSANPGWSAEKGPQLDAFLERGGGMVLLHYAVNGQKAPAELARRIGLAWQGGLSKFRHGPLDMTFTAGAHPITAGFRSLHLVDETYWQLVGNPADVDVLATAVEDGSPRPLLWTRQAGKGRVFCSIPGHYNWTFDDPLFRTLILRGIAWTASVPADRKFESIWPPRGRDRQRSGDRAPKRGGDQGHALDQAPGSGGGGGNGRCHGRSRLRRRVQKRLSSPGRRWRRRRPSWSRNRRGKRHRSRGTPAPRRKRFSPPFRRAR